MRLLPLLWLAIDGTAGALAWSPFVLFLLGACAFTLMTARLRNLFSPSMLFRGCGVACARC